MNRLQFLKRCAVIAGGLVAADQIELLERLTWKRRFFSVGHNRRPDWDYFGARNFGVAGDIDIMQKYWPKALLLTGSPHQVLRGEWGRDGRLYFPPRQPR
jgi:hypothetical protein